MEEELQENVSEDNATDVTTEVANSTEVEAQAETDSGDAEDSTNQDGASDDYADFEMPEGMTVNADTLDRFKPVMKDIGLNQEQAQKLATSMAEYVQAQQQAQVDAFTQQKSEWIDQAKADKEYGGDKFDESIGIALQSVDKFGTPELKDILNDYGIGNHPEVVRFMYRVGKALKEDVPGTGQSVQAKRDRASILYPNS